jgi:hypothetical protein
MHLHPHVSALPDGRDRFRVGPSSWQQAQTWTNTPRRDKGCEKLGDRVKSIVVKHGTWFVFVVFHRSGSPFRCAKVRSFAQQDSTILHEGLAPMLAFDCPGCGKHYELADDFAGKKSRCKQCGEVFRIPVLTARVHEQGSGGPPEEPQPQWEREPVEDPVVMKSAPPLRGDHDDSSLPLPPRAAYSGERPPTKRSFRHRDRGPGSGLTFSKWYLIVEAGLLVPIALANYFLVLPAPVVGMVTYLYLLVTALSCLVFSFWGWIWMVVIAFGEATRCGLMFMFLPFYSIYYIVTRYAETKGALSLVGAAIAVEIALSVFRPVLVGPRLPALRDDQPVVAAAPVIPHDNALMEGSPIPFEGGRAPTGPRAAPEKPRGRGVDAGSRNPSKRRSAPAGSRADVRAAAPPARLREEIESRYKAMQARHGARTIMIVVSGLPANSDPAKGTTVRDVYQALNKRIKELAPSATDFSSVRVGRHSAHILAPVDDAAAFAGRIDFGKITVHGTSIDVELSADFIDSVPR